ncbi:hypothetical protein ABMA27_015074 [Loxostege sticticalis]|uniref:Uncharacterized protein n=1 Tax=Loxostege sticticalis TaxID=481309 RepID=A0ABR3I6A0_LOXSC
MFREVQTFMGYCCQFDIPFFRQNVEDAPYVSGIETTEGLMVRINTDAVSPTGEILDGTALLYLFDHSDSITLLDSSVTLTATTFYDVNVDVWAIDSSDNVKALSLDKTVLSEIKDLTTESGCYQKCDYVQYETNVKYIRQTRKNPESSNYTTFLVHFADNSCMKYRREVIYSWDQLLANLGGIFGLCVGGSVISIIELIWFIIDLICAVFVNRKANFYTDIFTVMG